MAPCWTSHGTFAYQLNQIQIIEIQDYEKETPQCYLFGVKNNFENILVFKKIVLQKSPNERLLQWNYRFAHFGGENEPLWGDNLSGEIKINVLGAP